MEKRDSTQTNLLKSAGKAVLFGLSLCLLTSLGQAQTLPLLTLTLTPVTILITPTPTSSPTIKPTVIIYPNATSTDTPVNGPVPLYFDANFFNPTQIPLGINFRMDSDGQVKISVYNMAGEKVILLLNEFRSAGTYTLKWDGRNTSNAFLGNGVYFIILQTPSGQTIQKVILLK